VGAENDGAFTTETFYKPPYLNDLLGVEPDCGLIEDQHFRIVQQRLRDPDPLTVTFGEMFDDPVLGVLETALFDQLALSLIHI